MDMDPGEGTSDGRVKRRTNNIKVEIKQEPDIKEEPSNGSELGLTTRLSEGLGADTTAATLNIGLVDESKSDFDPAFYLNGVKEEVKCKGEKPSKGKDSSPNSVSNGNDPNVRGDQGDEPMVQSNASRTRLNPSGKGKKRDGSKKQNKRKIPRNKVAKKRTEQKFAVMLHRIKGISPHIFVFTLATSNSNALFVSNHLHRKTI
ncbi:uncharacterized protein LOC129574319 [Sitodiplosis mosellana]|uniref:uncharacterized protein LOC129574319 n=1 Tax=Sitodiplosis mosellana TaxID=263140 RepID=UPI00244452DE|nr:uncharacterized protein LOC129574319 [Sitodiplosis mosellana]XP_055312126.1 uncharacterized protein LOC129574319 [Sitodiplosis mosellana]